MRAKDFRKNLNCLPMLQEKNKLAGFRVFIGQRGVETPVHFCEFYRKKKNRVLIDNII